MSTFTPDQKAAFNMGVIMCASVLATDPALPKVMQEYIKAVATRGTLEALAYRAAQKLMPSANENYIAAESEILPTDKILGGKDGQ